MLCSCTLTVEPLGQDVEGAWAVWDAPLMRRDKVFWGPDREGLCPCGSHRRTRSCHGRRDGSWRGEAWSIDLGGSTGYGHPGCYATALTDCSTKLSREHYVSRAVLEEISSQPLVSGLAFLGHEERRLPTSGLVGKMLCTRHNTVLHHLDSEALKVFRTLRRSRSTFGTPIRT
jgi:hypothetical protein